MVAGCIRDFGVWEQQIGEWVEFIGCSEWWTTRREPAHYDWLLPVDAVCGGTDVLPVTNICLSMG